VRVLVADDDKVCRTLVASKLTEWGYEVIAVDQGELALEQLAAENAPTLVVLDWMMPGISGTEICKRLRAKPGPRYSYILLLTARSRMEEVVEGLDAGADDYLSKPFHASELRARLRAAQRILDLHERWQESRRELEHLATRDPLTQLWNRRAILDRLSLEAARAGREKSFLAVLLIDVDHFKQANDRCGHHAGDRVLCEVARRMTASLRPYDSLGRFGGEEFLAVLTAGSSADAGAVAERLCAAVAANPISAGSTEIPLSVSVGVATAPGSAPIDTEAFLHTADGALYRAKHEGRNRVCTALSSPDPRPIAAAHTGGFSTS